MLWADYREAAARRSFFLADCEWIMPPSLAVLRDMPLATASGWFASTLDAGRRTMVEVAPAVASVLLVRKRADLAPSVSDFHDRMFPRKRPGRVHSKPVSGTEWKAIVSRG